MKKLLIIAALCAAICGFARTGLSDVSFLTWAPTPPMGWNSWDCFGPTVVEDEVKANADYMADRLKDFGWEYVVVDIRWFVENDKAGGYNQTNPVYVYDEWGRYTPALNRFPSAAAGEGFRPLADYVHSKGLKFGIHIMRGIPRKAVAERLPVKGTDGITADMIASNDSACTWLRDNMKVDWTKPGAQQYYNSIFDLYAQWGVDFVKVDDLARPYHTAEVEMIRNAIDQCGRPMVLSISPGETPLEKVDHVRTHANMWRTVDDFWDNWSQLAYQFGICAKWAPFSSAGAWPDADMLPLGKISIRGERGAERMSAFSPDEQKTMMNLWGIFRSPLMFGGDLPQNDAATDSLLTNRNLLAMHHWGQNPREVENADNKVVWSSVDPSCGDRYAALFNIGGDDFINPKDALWRSGTVSYLTTGHAVDADVVIPPGSRQLVLVVTDGGDGFDSDHADWIRPILYISDGSQIDLTTLPILRKTCGWGNVHINYNLNGGSLSVDGTRYDKGFATHANSLLIFDLPEGAERLKCICGLDNSGTDQGSKASVEFMVFNYDPSFRSETTDPWNAGGSTLRVDPAKQAASSGFVCRNSANRAFPIEANIEGAGKLYLVVTNGGDNLSYDHADWVNPSLVRKDGSSVSLTLTPWDADPINGWNAPRLNLNNDGNPLTVDSVAYDRGFGVNAPSLLAFTLPENHDFVKFTAIAGLDSDTDNAPEGATVEFRVFTSDPSPDTEANVALNLRALGFPEGEPVQIRDLWTNHIVGTFSNSDFAPTLRAHASGLYRLSPLYPRSESGISINRIEASSNGFTYLEASVTGADRDGSDFVTIRRDGLIIAILPVGADGHISFSSPSVAGIHTYTAAYSGSPLVSPSEAAPQDVFADGTPALQQPHTGVTITPGKGCALIASDLPILLPIHTIDGLIAKTVRITADPLLVNLPAGTYIAAAHKFAVK